MSTANEEHVKQVFLPMRPGHTAGAGCSCGWHSHSKTFDQHLAEVSPSACGEELSQCRCMVKGEHTEHICSMPSEVNDNGTCHGRWIGKPEDDDFRITMFPTPPPLLMFKMYGVATEAELLVIATQEMKS